MRAFVSCLAAVILLVAGLAGTSRADLDVGLSIGDGGIKGFYLAIGEHYRVAEKEVIVVKKQKIPDEDLPVVFYLARRADVDPGVIMKLRLGGKSWMDITFHYGLTADIYYVALKNVSGPPYGKAYGHFKNKHKKQWRDIRFSDEEVVNFVNLRFISEHYGYSPDEVVKMRSKGKNFVAINAEVRKNKGQQKKQQYATDQESKSKGKKGKPKKK
jgi:hypothetical protein